MWLHRYAKFVSAATVLLIVAGGLVTSTGSGLAVPDWPTSYGWNMFTFPMKHMVGGIFYEHGHRLIASGVGFLTIILALWIWRAEPRRWMRVLGFTALGSRVRAGTPRRNHRAVFSPDAGVDRARRARADFLLSDDRDRAVHVARLDRADVRTRRRPHASRWSQRRQPSSSTCRSSSAPRCGTRMPDWRFPIFRWCSADSFPPEWTPQIAIHYAHRVGALIVTLAIAATAGHVWYHHSRRAELRRPALTLVVSRARAGDARRIRHLVCKRTSPSTPRTSWSAR